MFMLMGRRRAPVIVSGSRMAMLPAMPAHRHAQPRIDRRNPLDRDRKDQQRCGNKPEKPSKHWRPLYSVI